MLGDDGMAEAQQAGATALNAILTTATAATLDADTLGDVERRLIQVSDAIGHRYFLHGAEPLRVARPDAGVREIPGMIYDIRHITRFDYGGQVKFARCNLRLQPIDWPGQRLESYALDVEPAGRLSPGRAEAGLANVTRLVVDSPVRTLTIESRARMIGRPARPRSRSPDDPTLAEVAVDRPRNSRDLSAAGPANYLFPVSAHPARPRNRGLVRERSRSVARGARCRDHARPPHSGRVRIRRDRDARRHAPARRLSASVSGVCQDFAQIMITGLRAAGLPAAYASGYIRTIPPPGEARLVGADATHAWVLLWCGPVQGWVGVDPTNGIWMAGDHIVMAVGRDYAEIAPVDGVVLGLGRAEYGSQRRRRAARPRSARRSGGGPGNRIIALCHTDYPT